jgi:hypothetical protein
MGLLAKTNPTATRESVIREAMIFGAISMAVCLGYFLWRPPQNWAWALLAPLVGLLGGALGALMEWQLDDGVEIYYVVRKVEDEFAVKIQMWDYIQTVDDLYRATLLSLRAYKLTAVDEGDVWRRLRALLVRQLKLKPEIVVPSARFYIDLLL